MTAQNDARWMFEQLTAHFGPVRLPIADPVDTLILTILSQNTTDTNRDRAYAALTKRFPALETVLAAETAELENTIRVAGLQQQKARAIQGAVRRILDASGRMSLDLLRPMATDDAMSWLLELPGVGAKTAGIVVLFALRKPYFPIDTHIRRVLSRVGLLHKGHDPHRAMNDILPADVPMMIGLHLHTIRLGRTICRPRRPDCPACPLRKRCAYRKQTESPKTRKGNTQ